MTAILSARCPYLHQSGLETGGEVDEVITPSDDIGYENTVTDTDLTHIVSSPYPQVANLLDLRPLDPQSRHLAVALAELQLTRMDYATAAYLESFNWSTIFGRLRAICTEAGVSWKQQEFHVVIFRSVRQKNADVTRLGLLDQMSHQEACQSGGLLKYWFGKCNDQRQNLATCTAPLVRHFVAQLTDHQVYGHIAMMRKRVVGVHGTSKLATQHRPCTTLSRFTPTAWSSKMELPSGGSRTTTIPRWVREVILLLRSKHPVCDATMKYDCIAGSERPFQVLGFGCFTA